MAFIGNVSGSLTTTAGGKSYIRAGSNITITSGSTEGGEHFISIAGSAGGSVAADDISAGDAAVSLTTTSGNVTVDSQAGNAVLDGHTGVTVQATNSGDITLDSVGDVILDADGDQISFKFGGATGQLDVSNTNSGDITVQQKTDGKIISFLDHDGSANLNILDAGAGISLIRDSAAIKFGADEDILLTHEADRGLILTQGTETTAEPVFTIKNTGNLASGGGIEFVLDNGAGEGDDDTLGFISFKGDDSGDNATQFAKLEVLSSDVTNGDEGGQIKFSVMAGGTAGTAAMRNLLSIGAEDVANSSPAEVVVNDDSIDVDFRVETNEEDRAFFVDGGNDAITMFATAAERPGNALLFVSGAASAVAAVNPDNEFGAHFGGDIVVSGSVFTNGTGNFATGIGTNGNISIGNLLFHNGDTDTKIAFTADNITTTVGNVEMVRYVEDDSQDLVEFNNAEADVDFIVNNTNDEALRIDSTGVVFNEDGHATNDFRVEANGKTHMIFVDGGNDQLILGGAGEALALQDSNIVLSGTVGANDTPDSCVLVTSDLVVSGAILGGQAEGLTGRELKLVSQIITVGNQSGLEFGEDVGFFISGSTAAPNSAEQQSHQGVTLFGGSVVLSGSMLPGADNAIDLGGTNNRFRNIYTADLNLRNDRGNWTLIEEENFISFRNNDSGKRYRMLMEEITGDGSYGPGNDGQL